ncbi:hypothetical protein L798_07155 [Zootermopsis nevadensis]|uniref:EGF-like domain-containing protein n=2 Tax=Zootermopsis nevadensis TaxID=136037 RepID=A0A067RJS1_ZOONE|nr:hypothetical protein L798_07155 [Zootermopsis nevadensis]
MCNPGYTKDPINTSVCNLNIFSYECKTGYIKHNSLCIPYCPKGCTNGICTAPNTCKCKEGFVEDNENVCIFKNRSYSSTVTDSASDHQLHPAADTHIPLWVLLVCTAAISVLVIGTAIYLRYYRRERRPPPYSECNHGAGIWITSK